MINSVKTTVSSFLQKNNYGSIPVNDFNLFVKMAQLEIFDGWFSELNIVINRENRLKSGTGYADRKKKLEENIDVFAENNFLQHITNNQFLLPSVSYLNHRYRSITSVNYVDANGNHLAVIEKVTNAMIGSLGTSLNTAPSLIFPVYSQTGDTITILPTSISAQDRVKCRYIRYPKDPKWTYITMGNGEPIFNQSASDFQDLELPQSEESNIVEKVLLYAGVSIREVEAWKFAKMEENENEPLLGPNSQQ